MLGRFLFQVNIVEILKKVFALEMICTILLNHSGIHNVQVDYDLKNSWNRHWFRIMIISLENQTSIIKRRLKKKWKILYEYGTNLLSFANMANVAKEKYLAARLYTVRPRKKETHKST